MSNARQVRSERNDSVDALCFRHLGTTAGGVVEQTYALNRGLAALCGPSGILPEGTLVTLPDATAALTQTDSTVHLWD
ncbi:tail protein [Hylemonella gracilis str. Niagara R]|uniref:Tail protein n=1 Tax=Hylemonella gracilis str. Niagara R TaxID=1458275 RepID=A0A016XJR6_9BURK|nr:tail protein X [Hylemonella gracilis]EYC51458.1 tail protein [Hylemonella gracilis str. Niagara R]